ncbi:MAG: hypothetical protein H0V76_00440 [Blastocatellia bacterium]|nr:hypothetical protein [Blastocatellia bacterium]
MITGFNTDIEFDGVTYHVQTEDKGLAKPMILSLVYNRGTILASKRAPYDDLVHENFSEDALRERLQKQHKLICAAVQAGRIEELKKMTVRDAGRRNSNVSVKATAVTTFNLPTESIPIPSPQTNPADFEPGGFNTSIPKPEVASFEKLSGDDEGPLVEVINVIEPDIFIPSDAVAIVGSMAGTDRPANEKLSLEFLGAKRLKAGEHTSLGFLLCRGSGKRVVGDAQIMVKIMGSSFRPQLYHTITDRNGIARIEVDLPSFTTGRAAVIVRAIIDGEEVQMRRPIDHC